jgi:hypothetical protein
VAPTHGSIRPGDAEETEAKRPSEGAHKEVPHKLSCVVCGSGSYGNLCQACGGDVCPEHQEGTEEWCSLCEQEFAEFKLNYRVPPSALTATASVVVLSLLGAVASAWSAGNTGFSALLAPLLLGVVWAIVLPIASKLWVKLRFMRDLRPRRAPTTSADLSERQSSALSGELLPLEGEAELPRVPSVIPEYDRTTLHTSVASPIEPFATGLAAMLPPAEAERPVSEPPPSSRGPMVIRIDVPSLVSASASISPLDGPEAQLSALARLAAPSLTPQEPRVDPREEQAVSSVMPSALVVSGGPRVISSVVPTIPADAEAPITQSNPGIISISPAGQATPITLKPEAPAPVMSDESSVVHFARFRNERGVAREVCSPIVLNRCS